MPLINVTELFNEAVKWCTPNKSTEPLPEKVLDISEPVISIVKVIEEAPLNRFTIKVVRFAYEDLSIYTTYEIRDKVNQHSWIFRGIFSLTSPEFKDVEYLTPDEIELLYKKFSDYFNKRILRKKELEKKRLMRKREELTKLYCE